MNDENIILSTLGHTWVLDLDGTLLKHNGYKTDGKDTLLPGASSFIKNIPEKDMIIFLTSRTSEYKDETISFLDQNEIRYDHIIFDVPYGERILVNDKKSSGLKTSVAVNLKRDQGLNIGVVEDSGL